MYSVASNNGEVLHVKGVTRQECLEKIRDMHGTDFLILNQARKLTSGFCGFFQKDVYEVTYQLKPKPVKPQANDVAGRFGSFTNMSQLLATLWPTYLPVDSLWRMYPPFSPSVKMKYSGSAARE